MSNEQNNTNNKQNTAQNSLSNQEIRTASTEKHWITEKCGTNTPPTTTPANPPKNNDN